MPLRHFSLIALGGKHPFNCTINLFTLGRHELAALRRRVSHLQAGGGGGFASRVNHLNRDRIERRPIVRLIAQEFIKDQQVAAGGEW